MPAPAMKIPVQVDLESLKKQMNSGADHVGRAAKFMGEQFSKLNSSLAAGGASAATVYATGFAGAALRVVGSIGIIYGAAKLLGAAIDQARAQIEKMVDIANKAQDKGVSPRFLQGFTGEAEKLQVKVGDLEDALTNAFNATKDKAPIDLEKWDTGKDRISEIERVLRIYNATVAKAAGQQLEGLVLFRDAETQEQKVMAVLAAMVQLEAIGQRTAALDIGEKMFGSQFVDRMRQGRLTAAQMLETIKRAAQSGDVMFSDEMIRRAKEVDDKLKQAHQTLDKNLKPTWDELAKIALSIKNLWAEIVKLMAQAAGVFNFNLRGDSTSTQQLKRDLLLINAAIENFEHVKDTELGAETLQILKERRAVIEKELEALQAVPKITVQTKGPGPAPTPKDDDKDRLDALDRAILTAEKHTAVVEAETAAIDLGTAARQKAKVVAELNAAAIRANIDAGLKNTEVSVEQAAKIELVAAAFEKVAKKAEAANLPMRSFAREAADINRGLQTVVVDGLRGFEDALIDIGTQAKSAQQAFKEMTAAILKDLARLIIRMQITGPIAQALAASFSFSGASAGPGPFVGPVLPSGNSPLAPNSLASRAGMGGQSLTLSTMIDARGSNMSEARLHQIINERDAKLRQQIVPIMREARSRKVA